MFNLYTVYLNRALHACLLSPVQPVQIQHSAHLQCWDYQLPKPAHQPRNGLIVISGVTNTDPNPCHVAHSESGSLLRPCGSGSVCFCRIQFRFFNEVGSGSGF